MSNWPGRLFASGASRCACDMPKASLVQGSVRHSFMVPSCVLDHPFFSGALGQLGQFKLQLGICLIPFLGGTWQLGLDFCLAHFRSLGTRMSTAPDESQS